MARPYLCSVRPRARPVGDCDERPSHWSQCGNRIFSLL